MADNFADTNSWYEYSLIQWEHSSGIAAEHLLRAAEISRTIWEMSRIFPDDFWGRSVIRHNCYTPLLNKNILNKKWESRFRIRIFFLNSLARVLTQKLRKAIREVARVSGVSEINRTQLDEGCDSNIAHTGSGAGAVDCAWVINKLVSQPGRKVPSSNKAAWLRFKRMKH